MSPKSPRRPLVGKEPVQVYLEPDDRSLLDRVAKAAGISRAEVLRRGLRSYGAEQLRGKGPVLELMRSQQLQGAPRDLGELHDEHLAREYRGE